MWTGERRKARRQQERLSAAKTRALSVRFDVSHIPDFGQGSASAGWSARFDRVVRGCRDSEWTSFWSLSAERDIDSGRGPNDHEARSSTRARHQLAGTSRVALPERPIGLENRRRADVAVQMTGIHSNADATLRSLAVELVSWRGDASLRLTATAGLSPKAPRRLAASARA